MRANPAARLRTRANMREGALAVGATIAQILLALLLAGPSAGLRLCFGLDTRSLALGRCILGSVVAADAMRRMAHADMLLSDQGVWSRLQVVTGKDPQITSSDFSIFLTVGSPFMVRCLLGVGIFAGMALACGFNTRAASIYCWIHIKSLASRNSAQQQAGDSLLRLLLWWLIFLPTGQAYSLDAFLAGAGSAAPVCEHTILSVAGVGLMLQISVVYLFTAMFKVHDAWHGGDAIRYVCSSFAFSRQPLAGLLLRMPRPTLKLLTWTTVVIEFLALPLLLSPIHVGSVPLRLVASILFISFHLGLFAAMQLGLFPVICMGAWCLVIPSAAWGVSPNQQNAAAGTKLGAGEPESLFQQIYQGMIAVAVLVVQLVAITLSLQANFSTLPLKPAHDSTNSAASRCLQHLKRHLFEMGPRTYAFAKFWGFNQQWFLFDKPRTVSHCYLHVGVLRSGRKVDIFAAFHAPRTDAFSGQRALDLFQVDPGSFRVGDVSWESSFKNSRWRKLLDKLSEKRQRYRAFLAPYAHEIAKAWNLRVGKQNAAEHVDVINIFGIWHPISTDVTTMRTTEPPCERRKICSFSMRFLKLQKRDAMKK